MIYGKDLKRITPAMPFVLETVTYILIGVSILNLYLVADSTMDILQGDLEAVRSAHYQGLMTPAQIKAETMPSVFKYLYYLNTSTILCLPIFFYTICFEKKAWWYKALVFFASLSIPIAGIQAADRTEFILYAMMFLFCIIFFGGFLSKALKRAISFISIAFASLFIVYLVAVSEARFSERDGGASTSALQYAGQGYLNFCYFWEKGKFEYITAEREFPLVYHTLFKIDSDDIRRNDRSGEQGFFISVFATFIGDIMLDISPIGMIIWVLCYFFLCMIAIKSPHRKEMNIGEVIAVFVLSVVPIFGIFYYRFFSYTYTLMLIFTILLYLLSQYKIKI